MSFACYHCCMSSVWYSRMIVSQWLMTVICAELILVFKKSLKMHKGVIRSTKGHMYNDLQKHYTTKDCTTWMWVCLYNLHRRWFLWKLNPHLLYLPILFNLILYLFHEDYIQSLDATSSSPRALFCKIIKYM